MRYFSVLAFTLLLSVVDGASAEARSLKGDWEGAGYADLPGDPAPDPVFPEHKFSYDCQAEISDNKYHRANGKSHIYVALSRFTLTDERRVVDTSSLRWKTLKVSWDEDSAEEAREEPAKNAPQIDTAGHQISLGAYAAEEGASKEQVSLGVTLQIPAGSYFVEESAFASDILDLHGEIDVRVEKTLKGRGRQKDKSLALFVSCVRRSR